MSSTLLIILAFWALLLVAYAIWPLFGKDGLGKRLPLDPEVAQRYNEQIAAATAALEQQMRGAATNSSAGTEASGPSEIDLLRAQVEQLRSEVAALSRSAPPPRPERARLRRYATGAYTDLPRVLRRQVREVRISRRLVQI